MNKAALFIGIFFLSMSIQLMGQTSRIDSLIGLLDNPELEDSVGVEIVKDARKEMYNSNSFGRLYELNPWIERYGESIALDSMRRREMYMRQAYEITDQYEDFKLAEVYYLAAHELMPAKAFTGDYSYYIERPLGDIYTRLGDYEKAEYYIELSITRLKDCGDLQTAGRALSNLGLVKYDLGKYEEMLVLADEGIAISLKFDNPNGVVHNRFNLVRALLELDSLKPIPEILDQFESISITDDPEITSQLHELRAEYFITSGEYEKAEELLLKDLEASDVNKISRGAAKRYHHLGYLALNADNLPKAKTYAKKGLQRLGVESLTNYGLNDSIQSENSFFQLYELLGDVFSAQQMHYSVLFDTAFLCYQKALDVHDLLRLPMTMDESKKQSLLFYRPIINKAIESLYLSSEYLSTSRDSLALDIFKRAKSRLFSERVLAKHLISQLTVEQRQEYFTREEQIAELKTAEAEDNTDEILLLTAENQKAIQPLSARIDEFQGNFIDYLITDKNVFRIDNFSGQLRFKNIGDSKDLLNGIESIMNMILQKEDISTLKVKLKSIFDQLFQDIDRIPENFSVISDGPLDLLAFDLLVDNRGTYLVGNHTISLRFSHDLAPQSSEVDGVYCMVPDYGESDIAIAYERSDIYPLLYSKREAETLISNFPEAKIESYITAKNFTAALATNRIVHYAGHARPSEEYGALIIDALRTNINGSLIAHSVNNTELVVLSACETGVGRQVLGEGSLSMSRAFAQSGTSHTLSSLWTVNDQATSELMASFYTEFKKTASPAQALRNAKLDYLKNHQGKAAHPYYWSGFVVSSSVKEPDSKEKPWIYLLLAIPIILIILKITRK